MHLPLLLLCLCPVCPKLNEQHCWSHQTSRESRWLPSSSETLTRVDINKKWLSNIKLSAITTITMMRANLCVATRLCVPSPPTEGWCHSYWQGLSVLSCSLRSPSYRLLQACVASLSSPWPSSPPLGIPVLRQLEHKHAYEVTCDPENLHGLKLSCENN